MSDEVSNRVTIVERTGLEMVQVSAWPATSGRVFQVLSEELGMVPSEQPNTVQTREQTKVLSLAPYRWLIVTQAENQILASKLTARLSPDSAAVVELGAGSCVFKVSGPSSCNILAKYLPLDLAASKFPVGRCAQSAMSHIDVLVHAVGKDVWEIFVRRSFARHLGELLADSALEFPGKPQRWHRDGPVPTRTREYGV